MHNGLPSIHLAGEHGAGQRPVFGVSGPAAAGQG